MGAQVYNFKVLTMLTLGDLEDMTSALRWAATSGIHEHPPAYRNETAGRSLKQGIRISINSSMYVA